MRKIILFLCTAGMIFGLTACGSNNQNNTAESSSSATASSESSAADASGSLPESSSSVESSTADGSHNYEEGWTEEMTALRDAVSDALGENYFPDMALTPDLMESIFDISSDLYEDYMGEMPMISVNVDTLLIIKPKNDKVEEVKERLTAYRDSEINDRIQYPMNVGKVQASCVEQIGDYICFIQLGGSASDETTDDEATAIAKFQEQNELAIEAISKIAQ